MTRPASTSDIVTKEPLPNGEEIWRTANGEVRAKVPAPGVVAVTVIGHTTRATYPLMISKVEQEIAQGRRVSWFGDYESMTTYDPDVRTLLVQFVKTNKDNFAVLGILASSRIISLAVSVANLMVGGVIKVYASRDEYERAIRDRATSMTIRNAKVELRALKQR